MFGCLGFLKSKIWTAAVSYNKAHEKLTTFCFPKDNTQALSRLIEAARRCGLLLELIPAAIQKAEKALNESASSFHQTAKLSYCKALYSYYLGSTEDAIRLLIASKGDREFGKDALFKIVGLLINPENEIMGGEMFHSQFDDEHNENTQEVSNRMAEKFLSVGAIYNKLLVPSCDKVTIGNLKRKTLIPDYVSQKQEIQKNYGDSIDLQLMKAFLVFSSKQKNDIEVAISTLVKLTNEQPVRFRW